MDKIWFILVDGKREGPYSFRDLKWDERITPDTLVWKEGYSQWKRIRDVPELVELFKDEDSDSSRDKDVEIPEKKGQLLDELALEFGQEPPYLFWLLIFILILTYVIIQLFWV